MNNVTQVTETKQGSSGTVTDVTINHYDIFDRLKDTTQRDVLIEYGYDLNGNRTKVSSPNGLTIYEYDSRNRLSSARFTPDASPLTTYYTYYPDGKKDTVTYPNGTGTKYTYYDNNRIQSIVHTSGSATLSSYDYAYDVNGNRMLQKELQNGVLETTDYRYDSADRMTRFAIDGPDTVETTYTYDGYDRETERVNENGGLTKQRAYQYDNLNRLIDILDSTSPVSPFTIHYEYDNNGNTLSKSTSNLPDATETFAYDSHNQLIEVKRGPPGSEESLGKYDYNAEGMRVRHRNSERGDVDYYYDDNAVLEEHKADDNSLLAFYRYADRLISLETRDQEPTTRNQYYHHDALGSTVDLTDQLGVLVVTYRLDAWGHIRLQTGDSVNRQIFTGQEHDLKTGLIYFGHRYYDPDTARFISQDSYLGEQNRPPSLDRYLYAGSNPLLYIDPTGFDYVKTEKDGKVYWVVESDWIIPFVNPDKRSILIGELEDDKVLLTAEYSYKDDTSEKCYIPLKYLKKAASNFWGRYGAGESVIDPFDISDMHPDFQRYSIRKYISNIRPDRPPELHALGHEYDSVPYGLRSKSKRYQIGVRTSRLGVAAGVATTNVLAWVFGGPWGGIPVTTTTVIGGGYLSYKNRKEQLTELGGGDYSGKELTMSVMGDMTGASAVWSIIYGYDKPTGQPFELADRLEIGGHLAIALATAKYGPRLVKSGEMFLPNSAANRAVTTQSNSPLLQRYLSESGGSWGGTVTRQLNNEIASNFERQGFTITGGAGRASEQWIPGPGGSTTDGTWVDITATNGTQTIRIQTVTTMADGVTPTVTEAAAAARIRNAFPNDTLILIPKP